MKSVLVGLSALFWLALAACDVSTPDDAATQAGMGGAISSGGSTAGTGGSAGFSGSGVGGQLTGGSAAGGSGGVAGNGGSLSAGTGGALGGYGGGAAGGGGAPVGGAGGTGAGGTAAAGPVPGTFSLFDGKTLNGWLQGSPMLWSVVNGTLDAKGTTNGQLLMTQADYADFRVIVSSNLVAKGGNGHLGICFWGGRTPTGQYNNCKLIIPPDPFTWDYSLNSGLKGVNGTGKPVINPAWNTTEILCFLSRGFCRVGVNGTAALTYQEPNLQSIKAGPIGLQIHAGNGEEVQYKDVFVDPAPTVDKLLTVN